MRSPTSERRPVDRFLDPQVEFENRHAVRLWRDLRQERELNAELRALLVDARAQPRNAGSARAAVTPASTAAQGLDREDGTPSAAESAAASAEADQQFSARRREQLADPEYRMTFLAQARLSQARRHPGLGESLGLTAVEADKLFGILAERELAMRDMAVQFEDLPDEERLAARENAIDELNRKRDEALEALLGASKLQRFGDYSKEQAGWAQLAELNRMLEAPLNIEQSRPLVTMLATEQQRMLEALGNRTADIRRDPAGQARLLDELFAYQTQANQRTLAAAQRYLTARQLDALQTMLEQRLQQVRGEASRLRAQATSQRQ